MNILIICGETSANIYGSELAKHLKSATHEVYSFGDHHLAKTTTQLLKIDASYHSVGPFSWFRKRRLTNQMDHLMQSIDFQFDKVIIIDFPGYNFKIAHLFKSRHIPIVSFITPNFWLWNQKRLAKKLIDYSSLVITIFKKEYDFYRSLNNKKVVYLGHPLSLNDYSSHYYSGPPFQIGIFPGSRRSEIIDHMPVFLNIVSLLKKEPTYLFSIICANSDLHPLILKQLDAHHMSDIPIVDHDSMPLSYAISVPGTNTFRLALMGIPLTVIGQLHYLSYFIAKYILQINIAFIALPNIISDKKIVPEYIQVRSSTDEISAEILHNLNSVDRIKIIQNNLSTIKNKIQAPADYWQQISSLITK